MALPEIKKVPPGCEVVALGRNVFVCDPNASLAKGKRAAVWGVLERPGHEPRRIATSGIYKPRPEDAARGVVRLANWCGPERGLEETVFFCPPNVAARVIGALAAAPGKRRLRGKVQLQKFLARGLRSR